jgi:hypothetical protein
VDGHTGHLHRFGGHLDIYDLHELFVQRRFVLLLFASIVHRLPQGYGGGRTGQDEGRGGTVSKKQSNKSEATKAKQQKQNNKSKTK